MKISINGKRHSVKPASLMTVKEYIEFFDLWEYGMNDLRLVVLYLSITLKIDMKSILGINISDINIRRLMAYIGQIQDINNLSKIDTSRFVYYNSGKILLRRNMRWRSLGVRLMLQDRKTESPLELMAYFLAILIGGCTDAEKVEKVYANILEHNAVDVFPFAAFFFLRLQNGSNFVTRFLKQIRSLVRINTAT